MNKIKQIGKYEIMSSPSVKVRFERSYVDGSKNTVTQIIYVTKELLADKELFDRYIKMMLENHKDFISTDKSVKIKKLSQEVVTEYMLRLHLEAKIDNKSHKFYSIMVPDTKYETELIITKNDKELEKEIEKYIVVIVRLSKLF